MRKFISQAGLQQHVAVASAGTHDYHVGQPPDPRAQAAARRRGYELSTLRARQVSPADFGLYDLVLGMDFNNLEYLQQICPPEHQDKIGLLMPYATKRNALIVHDPYCRDAKDFDLVLECIEDACAGLVSALAPKTSSTAPQKQSDSVACHRPAHESHPLLRQRSLPGQKRL